MEYFLFNQKTNQSEGPYSISMLRELVKMEKILPESLLCPPGGNEWIQASTLNDLFTPAPPPLASTKGKDDFVHPLSKKGILTQQKTELFFRGILLIIGGSGTLIMGATLYYFIITFIGGFVKFHMKLTIIIPVLISCLSLVLLGIYFVEKSKKITIEN